jgi:hypothetical protein
VSVFVTLSNWGIALIVGHTSASLLLSGSMPNGTGFPFYFIAALLLLAGSPFDGTGFPRYFIALLVLTLVWLLFCIAVMLGNRSTGGWRLPLTIAAVLGGPVVLESSRNLFR